MAARTFHRRALLGAAGAALLASPALGQGFLQRPIRFICPFPAGGIVDILMRALNEELGAELGQPVVIDPRPGAGGLIGSQQLVAAGTDLFRAPKQYQSEELLIRAEVLPPAEVLRQATVMGAEVVGMQDRLGRVAEGYLADLLVVDGDPLADLGVLQDQGAKLALILQNGRVAKDSSGMLA